MRTSILTFAASSLALCLILPLGACGGDSGSDDDDDDDDEGVASEARDLDLPSGFASLMDGALLDDEAVGVWGVYPACREGGDWEIVAFTDAEAEDVVVFAWDMVGSGDLLWAELGDELADEEFTVWADADDIGTPCDGDPVLFGAAARGSDSLVGRPGFTGWFGEDAYEANVIYSYGSVSSGSQVEYGVSVDGEADGVEMYALNPVAGTVSANVQLDDLGEGEYGVEVDTRVLGGSSVDALWVGFMATWGGEAVGLAGS